MISADFVLVMVLVDAADKKKREELHPDILTSLKQNSHIPSVLVLNKVCGYLTKTCKKISYHCSLKSAVVLWNLPIVDIPGDLVQCPD